MHATRSNGSMGRSREPLHVLNTNEINDKREFARFRSLQACGNKVRLAALNFRRIFLARRNATVN